MGPTLVGRSAELAVLTQAVRGVADGDGSVVHIVGEAGIGKTSLLHAATAELDRLSVTSRQATADEIDRRRPFALVRSLFPDVDRSTDEDPVGRAIAAVERLAADGPAAVIADDVHWADDGSLDALRATARRAATLGVLLITAARSHPSPPALRRYEDIVPNLGERLMPTDLGSEHLAALTEARTGSPPGPHLTDLLTRTAGNPFLAVELLEALVADDALIASEEHIDVDAGVDVPEQLVERIARRTLLAIPDGDLVLRAAAALPGSFTAHELAAMLDLSLADVLTAVMAGVDAAVFVDDGASLAFRHALLRRAVVDATPPSVMRSLSLQAAEVLTNRGASRERIATCVLEGSDPSDPADLERLIAAGVAMRDAHNPAAAADLLYAALDGIAIDDPRSDPTTVALGWVLADAGRAREIPALLDDRFPRGRTFPPIEVQRLRGHALTMSGQLEEAAQPYGDEGRRAAEAAWDPESPEQLEIAAELALLRVLTAKLSEGAWLLKWYDASPIEPPALAQANASTARAWLLGLEGSFEAAAEAARSGIEAAQADRRAHTALFRPTMALAVMLDGYGNNDGALEVLRHADLSPPTPQWMRPLLQFTNTVLLYRRGEWDDALAEAEAGLVAAEETDLALGVHWPFAIGTAISCFRGQQAVARDWLDRAQVVTAPTATGAEWLVYATALVHEAEGDREGAAEILGLAVDVAVSVGAPALLQNPGADTVRLARATGRTDLAARVVSELAGVANRTDAPAPHAVAGWARGIAERAYEDIAVAADTFESCHRVPEAARASHDAAVIAAQQGAHDDARRLANRAFSSYDGLGAEQLHARLRSELRDAGLPMRPRRSPPRPETGWGSLTPSERTVVDHVGEGLTNSEIAERLFVSRRTVESHLTRVYTKLGLTTRPRLVAAVARERAGDRS